MRHMAGNPSLLCIKPRGEWANVPAGYSYSAVHDAFVDAGGQTWKPASSADLTAADVERVSVLPGWGSVEDQLTLYGIAPQGSRTMRCLPADIATVRAAEWVEIDGQTYDVSESTPLPAGTPVWYALRLTKR